MESFRPNVGINLILSLLSYAGAIGFIVFADIWHMLRNKQRQVTFTTKIILTVTSWIIIGGTFLIFIQDQTLQKLPAGERLLTAFFQTVSASTTAGFNTYPIGTFSAATLLILILVMVIGASPSGTGGGVKTTSFSAIFSVMKSTLTGKSKVECYGREIPEYRIRLAITVFVFYTLILMTGCYLLTLTETQPFEGLFFESASALGTVGLSTGITASLSDLGKFFIIIMMFIGRLGPIIFGMALFSRPLLSAKDKDIAI